MAYLVGDYTSPTMMSTYEQWCEDITQRVHTAQLRAVRRANAEVIRLFWSIGSDIAHRQTAGQWDDTVRDRFVMDMQRLFKDHTVWTAENIALMVAFAGEWPELASSDYQPVEYFPWSHITTLLQELDHRDDRYWYGSMAIAQGWSHEQLSTYIHTNLRGSSDIPPPYIVNRLPPYHSVFAHEMTTDPYLLEIAGVRAALEQSDAVRVMRSRLEASGLASNNKLALVSRNPGTGTGQQPALPHMLLFHCQHLAYVLVHIAAGAQSEQALTAFTAELSAVEEQMRIPEIHKPTCGMLVEMGSHDITIRYGWLPDKPGEIGQPDTALNTVTQPHGVHAESSHSQAQDQEIGLPSSSVRVASWNHTPGSVRHCVFTPGQIRSLAQQPEQG